MSTIRRKLAAISVLGAWLGFSANAHAAGTTSSEFLANTPADSALLAYDGYSVTNTSTTRSVLVIAPIGVKSIQGTGTISVEVYIDNGTDSRATTCSVFGHSSLTPVESAGTASTTAHGRQTLTVDVTTATGSTGSLTFFSMQCNLPKGGTHKIFGSFAFPGVER